MSTDGFQQADCKGNIQSANKIGFWCDWSGGDGSVMMIGGGGSSCTRADHGIGIIEAGAASSLKIVVVKLNMTLVMMVQQIKFHLNPTR